jgi:ribosomal protein S12 methylthiotransferase
MNQATKQRPVRVGVISLGCAKNLVDAEIMLGSLMKEGVEITNDAAQADVVIVNTCSFIDSAQEESVDTILQSAALRDAQNRGQGLIVSGCLPQRFRDELPKLLPEVDAFMGIDQVSRVTEIVHQALAHRQQRLNTKSAPKRTSAKVVSRLAELDHQSSNSKTRQSNDSTVQRFNGSTAVLDVTLRPNYIPDFATPRFRLTPKHFAYVKIAEGCNHPCSFCIIPRMRGAHRSRAQSDIVREARQLLADGVKELNLISQDTTYYGLDLRPNRTGSIAAPDRFTSAAKVLPGDASTLCTLLRELNALPGDFWIRLLYTHPAHWTDELIQTIAECPKVARYVDMPLQHIDHNMLERMRRETSQQYIIDLIRKIRAGIPGIALRTTFIVGFPGETEAYFQTLLDFIKETRFERLGVFTYSREEGTRAGKMAGQIPDKVKRRRRDQAMTTQHEIAVAVSESYVGGTIKVLVENEASAKELRNASISSWEHGLLRSKFPSESRRNAGSATSARQAMLSSPSPLGGDRAGVRGLRGRYLIARGEADAPDIDGRVYIKGKLLPGDFAQVRVIGHTDYDLVAEPV